MHVRLRIALIFTAINLFLLAVICSFTYYLAYTERIENVREKLTNKALTTANMIHEPGIADAAVLESVERSIISPVQNRVIEVFDYDGNGVFSFRENASDFLLPGKETFERAKQNKFSFFNHDKFESVVYNHTENRNLILVSFYDASGKGNLRQLGFLLILVMAAGVVVAFAAGYYFSTRLIKPIRKIADEVNKISAQSLTQRIRPGSSDDDWNYLIITLNDLLNRLHGSFEIQKRFISSASHELSTPLISVSSQIEVCLQRERTSEEYKEVMKSVLNDIRHLVALTQTLLKFATVSGSGGIELSLIRVDEVLMLLPAEIRKVDSANNVRFDFDNMPQEEEHLMVFGNSELLLTAIINLVSNACKYSDDRLAQVVLSGDSMQITIEVKDNGKGIPEQELENIFEPFYRTEDSRSIKGFGVGLPLVKRIIKLHNGSIKVNSKVGKGTVFQIILPLAYSVKSTS